MSDRIFISSASLGGSNAPSGLSTFGTQETANIDIRYSGIVNKPRFHPRIIIRPFRTTNLSSQPLQAINPIEFQNFILTDADEQVEEKFQVVQTFGPDFVFFYGPKPRIFNYSGILYNTSEKPWVTEWQKAWDTSVPGQTSFPSSGDDPAQFDDPGSKDNQQGLLSATNVIVQGGIVRLEYDGSYGFEQSDGTLDPSNSGGGSQFIDGTIKSNANNVVCVREGWLIRFGVRRRSDNQNAASFNLSMFVTNRMNF